MIVRRHWSEEVRYACSKVIDSEFSFQILPKWDRIGSPKRFEIQRVEVMEGFLIQCKIFSVWLSSERQAACGYPTADRSGESEEVEKRV